MKPRPRTDLERWMQENRYSDAALAAAVTAVLPEGKSVSASSVTKWRLGKTMPRKAAMRAIGNITGGIVTGESFVHAEGP